MDKMEFFKFIIVIGTLLFNLVQCSNECHGSDINITETAESVFKNILSGEKHIVGPIDPMEIKDIDVKVKDLQIKLVNIKFTNLKSCKPTETINTKEYSYSYVLKCSQLVLTADATAKGCLGLTMVDNKDSIKITANDYVIKIKGHYDLFVSKKDKTERFKLRDVTNTDTIPQGKIKFETGNTFGLSKIQAITAKVYLKRNRKLFNTHLERPIIQEFISKLLVEIDTYIKAMSAEELLELSDNKKDEM